MLLPRLRPRPPAVAARQVLLVQQVLLPPLDQPVLLLLLLLSPLLLLRLPRHVEHLPYRPPAEHLPAPHKLLVLLLVPSAGAPAKKHGTLGAAGIAQPSQPCDSTSR